MVGLRLPKKRTVEVPARIWKRALSFMVDLFVINVIILYPFNKYFKSIIPTSNYEEAVEYVLSSSSVIDTLTTIAAMFSILSLLYFSICGFKTGTTVGKFFFKIKTKSLNKDAKYWQFLVSSLTFMLFTPTMLLWVIDPIHMFFSEKKQRLMERISKLETVEEVNVT